MISLFFFQVNETWGDACKNYSCVEVDNPCYPNNKSAQIIVNQPICPKCPVVSYFSYNRFFATSCYWTPIISVSKQYGNINSTISETDDYAKDGEPREV